jgi:hypothetical protein
MRLYITNEKEVLVGPASEYLLSLLKEKRVELIINGNKHVGVIHNITLDEEQDFIVISIGDKVEKVPLLDDTKARFGKELVVLETKNHTTVIELLD